MSARRSSGSLETREATSAGGIVYRRDGDGGVEIVVCGRSSERLWGLPKGTPNPGESLEETALREVCEETGLDVEIEQKVGTVTYWFARPAKGVRFHKSVHHYLMRATGGDVARHDHEYDTVVWLPADHALQALSHENEANILRKALALIAEEAP